MPYLYKISCDKSINEYYGVTNNVRTRFSGHKTKNNKAPVSCAIRKYNLNVDSHCTVLFEGTYDECLVLEAQYRPRANMGWNVLPGGGNLKNGIVSNIGGTVGPCSQSRRDSIKKARLKTKKEKCPHCDKQCDPGNYKRFHGNNCKHNPNVDLAMLQERIVLNTASTAKALANGKHNSFTR